jgi:hypothetical protein
MPSRVFKIFEQKECSIVLFPVLALIKDRAVDPTPDKNGTVVPFADVEICRREPRQTLLYSSNLWDTSD